MSVSKLELKCYEYVNAIKDLEDIKCSGLYRADQIRTELHDEICALSGLEKEDTKYITDNLDTIGMCGTKLYLELLKVIRAKGGNEC